MRHCYVMNRCSQTTLLYVPPWILQMIYSISYSNVFTRKLGFWLCFLRQWILLQYDAHGFVSFLSNM